MHSSTSLIRLKRLIVLGSVVTCAAALAVGASASRTIAAPDVFERYAATHNPNSATAPDVLERYVTAHSLGLTFAPAVATDRIVDDSFRDPRPVVTPIATPDVFERYAATHNPNSATASDVVERYVTTHSLGLTAAATAAGTDRIVDDSFRDTARYVPAASSGQSGLDWGDFGIGAGAMLGLTLLVTGLGLGVVAMRHRGGKLETS